MTSVSHELARIQSFRSRRERDLTIGSLVRNTADEASRTQKRLGALIDIWHDVIPPHLAKHAAIRGLRGGTLEVEVDSGSVLYELDRTLRAGATDAIRRRYRGALVRVRLRLAS